MRSTTSFILIAVLFATPSLSLAQNPVPAEVEIAAFKQLASGIPLGSRITVQAREGRRLNATLMSVDEQGIVVKRDSRIPEPAIRFTFAELKRLHRNEKSGFSLAKAVGIGLAAGVGAILTLLAIAVSIDD